jgi:hypothetical protein
MSQSHGTSNVIKIGGEGFRLLKTFTVSKIDKTGLKFVGAPELKDASDAIGELLYRTNRYPHFVFPKICPPQFPENTLAAETRIPGNEPDFISDFHFIGLMRSIDHLLKYNHTCKITGFFQSVKSGQ